MRLATRWQYLFFWHGHCDVVPLFDMKASVSQ
jgi:hypothetical protein